MCDFDLITNKLNSNRMTVIITLGIGIIILAMSTHTDSTSWSDTKTTLTDKIANLPLAQNFGNNIMYLIGVWIGLLVLGGYVLTHIHLRVLKEEQK
jgi:hypothetical protein